MPGSQKEIIKYEAVANLVAALNSGIDSAETATNSANQAAADAEVNYNQVIDAISEAMANSDVDPDYISYDLGVQPGTAGAAEGTIGAYFKSDGTLQKLKLETGAWTEIPGPGYSLAAKKYVDDKASLSKSIYSSIWNPQTEPALNSYFDIENDNYGNLIDDLWKNLRLSQPDYISVQNLGPDESGTYSIYQYKFEPDNFEKTIVINAGVHGNEKMSSFATYRFFWNVVNNWQNDPHLWYARTKVRWIVIPSLNPWGFNQGRRDNSNGVDINRNYGYRWDDYSDDDGLTGGKGSAAFSELESQYARDTILNDYPDATAIIDVHDLVNQVPTAKYYLCGVPSIELSANRKYIADLLSDLKRDSYDASTLVGVAPVSNTMKPTASNYFNSIGYNSCTPEWSFNAPGSSSQFDAEDMTEAVRWFGNLFIRASFVGKQISTINKGFHRNFRFNGLDTVVDSVYPNYETFLPEYNFTPGCNGIVTLHVNMVVDLNQSGSVYFKPYLGQDSGWSETRASQGVFNPDMYADVDSAQDVPISFTAVLPVNAGNIVRVSLQGCVTGGSATIDRGIMSLIFQPFDGDFQGLRTQDGWGTAQWYGRFPDQETPA